ADRYLSDKAAFGVLAFCLIGIGWLHRNWLNSFRHEHRFWVVSLSVLIFASCGLAVGLWITKQGPSPSGGKGVESSPQSGAQHTEAQGGVTPPPSGQATSAIGVVTPVVHVSVKTMDFHRDRIIRIPLED